MVLEATVIILDNSEWMRNGDYLPTRLEAQNDAVQLLCNAKRQANVENAVALVSMGGNCPKVLVSLTSEQSKLLHAINSMEVGGEAGAESVNLVSALKVAQLILKHRQNPNQRQRIVAFVGSPLSAAVSALEETGRFLKKNNVAVDIVSFGSVQANEPALTALHAAVSIESDELASHLVNVHPGTMESLADALMASPIFGGSGSSNSDGFGMIDAEMDPELAMALKLSLEEEQARQAASEKSSSPEDGQTAGDLDEDAMMQQAIAMSLDLQEQQNNDKQ